MVCYAYRSSDSEELLLNHLIGVGDCCRKRWEFYALSSKVSRALKLPLDGVRSAILLSSLLHDIGKAAQMFQEQCRQGSCTQFHGHYLVSTFLIHLALNTLGISVEGRDVSNFIEDKLDGMDRDKVIGILILLPTAFHHYHQVQGFRSYSLGESLSDFVKEPKIYCKCVEDLRSLTENLTTYTVDGRLSNLITNLLSVLPDLEMLKNSDLYKGSKLFIDNFYWNVIERGVRLMSITLSSVVVESIAGLINLCDGYVAYRARNRVVNAI